MRFAPEAVKLQFDHVGRFRREPRGLPGFGNNTVREDGNRSECKSAILSRKKPANIDIFAPIVPFRRIEIARFRNIDENGSLPYKPANCPRWPGPNRGGSFGPETARFGPTSIGGLTSLSGKLSV